jgi:hypothetical protein
MADLQWLDGYGGQTVDELIGLERKHVTSSLVLAFEQALHQKAARVGASKLSEEERVILAVEALEREVNNGGYDQFFVNTPEYAPIIVDALRRIGCPKTAEITDRAVKAVQRAPIYEDNKERDDALGDCDSLYCEGPEYIGEGLFAFIKANRANIEL